jgi:hypothetical protein
MSLYQTSCFGTDWRQNKLERSLFPRLQSGQDNIYSIKAEAYLSEHLIVSHSFLTLLIVNFVKAIPDFLQKELREYFYHRSYIRSLGIMDPLENKIKTRHKNVLLV